MTFKDHFSGHSDIYAKYRPHYPDELYQFLFKQVKDKQLAWDCGTGTGQVALALANYFDCVMATDASDNQIKHAKPHPKVSYRVAKAEDSGLEDNSTDLITVGQAIHWFNFDAFYEEAKRVGKPGSLIAIWTYGLHKIDEQVDPIIDNYYTHIVGAYWPPERKHIDAKYETIPFPFEQIPHPSFEIKLNWDLDMVLGYLNTWSATQRYIKENGENPLNCISVELQKAWGNSATQKTIRWPVYFKAGFL